MHHARVFCAQCRTDDSPTPNTGNTEWSAQFLAAVYGDERLSVFVDHPWWENAAMAYALRFLTPGQTHRHLRYVPQRECNSYPPELHAGATAEDETLYEDGDFIVAFSGCGVITASRERCNELYRRYGAAAAGGSIIAVTGYSCSPLDGGATCGANA